MRIIAGKYRGRKLAECREFKELRPTSDKNRENLFNILQSPTKFKEIGFELENCRLLDVFAGSGAVSLEALSRGMKSAALIDKNRPHLELAKKNAENFGENDLEYYCLDLSKKVFKAPKQFNLIFIDPPYNKNLALISLENLINANWIEHGALIVVEHFFAEKLNDLPANIQLLEQKQYKDTIFTFLILNSDSPNL
ncbi:MAG: 16S rRNA (guanine966-N2)-methyltransferase [Lentimonas sp.]|jgi:16S rRNA (guanine966-N2)-methyltransferase